MEVVKIKKNSYSKTLLIKEKTKPSIDNFAIEDNTCKNKQTIATLKFANSYFSRLKGLMFKKRLDYVLVLKPAKSNHRFTSSIHTLFMRFTIDVVFLDKEREVFEITQIAPWKFYIPKRPAAYILEMKKGSIEKYQIAIGDKLDFVCEFR
ncbi:MAG: DUF192 domain-containing protein [Methanobrevibacter sp.]|nr:DUF192 domain-containing protein [Methanobrevibacter sp.]